MFALSIHFLTGRYVATAFNDRRRAEWPPHPARVYSALVATHFESAEPDAGEREALRWLECQPPPELLASDADRREVVDVFVPVNDAAVLDDLSPRLAAVSEAEEALSGLAAGDKQVKRARSDLDKARTSLAGAIARAVAPFDDKIPAERARLGLSLLPDRRVRQARTFPSVTPHDPRMVLVWRDAEPSPSTRRVLDGLAARVVRLGHSASLVAMRVVAEHESVTASTWVPDIDGTESLRVVEAGQFDQLCTEFARHRGSLPRVMPTAHHGYARPRPRPPAVPASIWGSDWIVLARVSGRDSDEPNPRLPATRTVDVTRAVRDALMAHADPQPAPEFLTGHGPTGAAADRPHLAIVALPFVGGEFADGLLRGVALVLPRDASPDERRAVLRAMGRWEAARGRAAPPGEARAVPILLGTHGKLWVRRAAESDLEALAPRRWSRTSRHWGSVTPVALDRHPGDLWHRDPATAADALSRAQACVADACERLGLPRPSVEVMPYAPVVGAEKTRHFPRFPPVAGRPRRVLVHATLRFEQSVAGPILIGAGRYHGLGLMLPLDGGRS